MADDGMLLNFQIGTEPLKQRVKFTGGRWRDRKRAENSARRTSAHAASDKTEAGPGERAPKRQRVELDGAKFKNGPGAARSEYSVDDLTRRPGKTSTHNESHGRPGNDSSKGPRQVVSSLFSFNPKQQTTAEKEEAEWKAPEATNAPLSDVANFGTLSLSSRLVDELSKMNLERPTAIQNKVIPHLLAGEGDAFVQAETGSGKTLSYLLPVLHRVLQLSGQSDGTKIHRDSGVFAIIVAPTRELARQTHNVLEQLIRPFPWLVSTAITGGESKKAEKSRIRKGVNFLVATPGRLADHIDNTKALYLGTVRWLILDEGDRLMDLGFEDDLKKTINTLKRVMVATESSNGTPLKGLPDRRVTVLCSATMKMNVQKLGEMSLADATFLAAEKEEQQTIADSDNAVHKAPAQLHQSHIIVPAKLRLVTLISYLRTAFSRRGKMMKTIIFISCADSVDFHFELLKDPTKTGYAESLKEGDAIAKTVAKSAYITSPASPDVILHRMHGSLTQQTRTATIKAFSTSKLPSVLITTDVSSRGLDIPSVDLVIEYDPAFSFSDHIHRVGRTARAGKAGDAVLFLLPGSEEGYIELLKQSTPPTALSFESVLQNGSLSKMEFPVDTTAKPSDGRSYHDKAEAIQLHFEQRLLGDSQKLELGRNGFKSHIRAYATHTKEERVHFDMTELHLGHVAKSFGLRDPPGGIGAGLDRKGKKKGGKAGQKGKDQDEDADMDPERPAREMLRRKSMMLMRSAADEFNIG